MMLCGLYKFFHYRAALTELNIGLHLYCNYFNLIIISLYLLSVVEDDVQLSMVRSQSELHDGDLGL